MTTPAHNRRKLLLLGPAAIGSAMASRTARAAWQPVKPLRFIVSQAPGATTDATARAFGDYMAEKLGVPVAIDNRPGAGGMIAAETTVRANPDGYTYLVTLHSQLAQAPVLFKKPPIDPDRDLVPIAALTPGVLLAMARPGFPATNIKEVVELSRKQPVTVGNYSVGSGWQMQVTQLIKESGGQFIIVSYKGTGPMLTDLAGGQVDIGASSLLGAAAFLQRGTIKPLVIISDARSRKLPGTPTWAETGFTSPAFTSLLEYNMLLAPTGTPPEAIARLAEVAAEASTQSQRIKSLRELSGSDEAVLTGEPLRKMIAQVWPTYRSMTRDLGLKSE